MKLLLIAILPALLFAACSACDGAMHSSPATEVFRIENASADAVAKTLAAELASERRCEPRIVVDAQANCLVVGPLLRSDLIWAKKRIHELDIR